MNPGGVGVRTMPPLREGDGPLVLVCAILNQLAVDIGDRMRRGESPSMELLTRLELRAAEPLIAMARAFAPGSRFATEAGILQMAKFHAGRSRSFARDRRTRRTAAVEKGAGRAER